MNYDRYKSMTDEELIMLLRDGDTMVEEYLCDKYKPLVRKKAKSMYILGAEPEDTIQEGMIGLFKAVKAYDSGRDASFYTFASLCITRQIYTAITAAQSMNNSFLNSYISLSGGGQDNDNDKTVKVDEPAEGTASNPEEILIAKEHLELMKQGVLDVLSGFEKQVFELQLTGMGYVEIANVLGRDEKSVDNALQRIKSKSKKLTD